MFLNTELQRMGFEVLYLWMAVYTMTIKEKNLTNKGATLVLTNNSDKNFQYGNPYKIEIKKDGEWHKINVEVYFDMPAFQLSAKESKRIVLDWENGYGKLAKKLTEL